MTSGSLYGYEIRSELPLRRLAPVEGPRGLLELRRADEPLAPAGGRVVHRATDAPAFTLTRAGADLHVHCEASGEFLLAPPDVVHARPNGCDEDLWEHRAVTTALPLLLAERGDLVVHAAAIEAGGCAVLLAGAAGRGKSTTALAAAALGYPVLAEDGAAVDLTGPHPVVWPGPLGVRAAVEGSKRTVFPAGAPPSGGAVPVGAVLVLGERGAGLSVTPVEPAAAVPLLLPHLVYGGSDRLREAFARCARLVSLVPVRRCSLPDGLDALPFALDRLLSSGGAPTPG